MKRKNKKDLYFGLALSAAFVLWTLLVTYVDVQAIGPGGSSVGFAKLNGFFHRLTGVHMSLYTITDWLGLVPVFTAFGFFILGLLQWITRKSILKVDRSILVLGAFYATLIAVYLLFEELAINYRPILINGYLEASYPSSTTLLVASVMPTALIQLNARIKPNKARLFTATLIICFTAFTLIGRIISGVHWITDIIGGAFFSAGLVLIYRASCGLK